MNIYQKYARLLVEYSLQLKKGDKFLIRSSYIAEPLIKEVYKLALEKGAFPETQISVNGLVKDFYDGASDEQLQYVSPIQDYITKNFDALLSIESPFNLKALQNVDPAKKQMAAEAKRDLNKIFMERAAKKEMRWTLCVFPTDSQSQEAAMSKSEYEEFVYSACLLYDDDPVKSWQKLRDDQQRIIDLLNTKEPLDLYFKPLENGFPDGILRVEPDILPKGSVRISEVKIDNKPWKKFDADAMTVTLPNLMYRPKIKVTLVPVED